MSGIAFLDLLTAVILMGSALGLMAVKKALARHGHIRRIVMWLLFFLILHFSALFVEWKDSDRVFDVLEDFLGTLIPMWWAFLFYGISQEISNADLRRSKERFEQFIENQPVGMFRSVLEGDGRFLMANSAMAEMLGYSNAGELMRQPLASLFKNPEERKYVMAAIHQKGLVYAYDLEGVKKDGAVFYGSLTLRLLNDPAEGPAQVDGTLLDISKRKKAEAELRKSEKMLQEARKLEAIGRLARGIAHDFNNILTPMMGYTDLAIREVPENSPVAESLHEVIQAGMRARDLVSQILAFSRESETESRPVRVEAIIREVVQLIRPALPPNIEVSQELSVLCPPISADPTQVHQIVMNLCKNASQAIGPNGGRITISLGETDLKPQDVPPGLDLTPGRYLRLVVADTGQGMKKEVADRIFDPYFTTKKKGEGTGLGLAIVHGIVKKYQGDIAVRSELGRGASFSVYLPSMAKDREPLHS